jgi:hypothetical protein
VHLGLCAVQTGIHNKSVELLAMQVGSGGLEMSQVEFAFSKDISGMGGSPHTPLLGMCRYAGRRLAACTLQADNHQYQLSRPVCHPHKLVAMLHTIQSSAVSAPC